MKSKSVAVLPKVPGRGSPKVARNIKLDVNGRIQSITYPRVGKKRGITLRFTYDDQGRLESIQEPGDRVWTRWDDERWTDPSNLVSEGHFWIALNNINPKYCYGCLIHDTGYGEIVIRPDGQIIVDENTRRPGKARVHLQIGSPTVQIRDSVGSGLSFMIPTRRTLVLVKLESYGLAKYVK